MLEAVQRYFFPCLLNIISGVYIFGVITNRKLDLKNYRLYLGLLVSFLLIIFCYVFINSFIRFFVITFILFVIMLYVYRSNIKMTFIGIFIEQSLMLISEIIFTFLAIIIFGLDKNYLVNEVKGAIITNVGISIICIMIANIKFIKNKYPKLLRMFENISSQTVYVFILFVIFTMNILLILVYSDISIVTLLVINTIFIIIYTAIILVALNEKSENVKFKKENEMLLDNLNQYEKMLDYQRASNHENKNQLLVIKEMIGKNNKKVLNYLDEVIKEKRKDSEELYAYAKIIPEGGLQGLIYQKMLKMKENNIKIDLNIDRGISKINFDSMSSKTKYNLCRAIGIILDNAIDEVLNLFEKEILIIMYSEDNQFVVEVTNKCKNIPDLSKIDEKGYTTKSYGHGYGLSLLKDIILKNDDITNERFINKDIFTQIIKIKM